MLADLPIVAAASKGNRLIFQVSEVPYMLELTMDSQRWVRTGPLGTPFIPGTLKPTTQRGF